MFIADVSSIPLLPRPAYKQMIVAGNPEVFGRIFFVSDDRRTAYLVWRATPGTLRFTPDPITSDSCVVIAGSACIRQNQHSPITIRCGAFCRFPNEPFELEIQEEFLKVSFLYDPEKLMCQAETL